MKNYDRYGIREMYGLSCITSIMTSLLSSAALASTLNPSLRKEFLGLAAIGCIANTILCTTTSISEQTDVYVFGLKARNIAFGAAALSGIIFLRTSCAL